MTKMLVPLDSRDMNKSFVPEMLAFMPGYINDNRIFRKVIFFQETCILCNFMVSNPIISISKPIKRCVTYSEIYFCE